MSYVMNNLGNLGELYLSRPCIDDECVFGHGGGLGQNSPAPASDYYFWGGIAAVLLGVAVFLPDAVDKRLRNPKKGKRKFKCFTPLCEERTTHKSMHCPDHRWVKNRLTDARRNRIPLSQFAIPERRAFPLDTKSRAETAVAYLRMGRVKPGEYRRVRDSIMTKWPSVWFQQAKGLTEAKSMAAHRRGMKHRSASKMAA